MGCFNSKAVASADPFGLPVQPLSSPTAHQDVARVESLKKQATDIVTDADTLKGAPLTAKAGKVYLLSLFCIQGRDLPGADRRLLRKRTSDPYVKARVVFDDGTTTGWQQSKWHAATLNPVFNHRFDFTLDARVPKSVELECLDYDALSAHDPLGKLRYSCSAQDLNAHPPVRWFQLKETPSGALQLQVQVEELDPTDEKTKIKLNTAERTGLITLRMESVTGFRPGPHAIKVLGEETFKTGAFTLKAFITCGLRQFASRAVPGCPVPHASPKAATSAPADTASEGPSVPLKQDLKIWQRQGEEQYLVQVTLLAVSTAKPSKAAVVGKGYVAAAVLADSVVHTFNCHLREEPPKEQDLTDAEQSAMLSSMGLSPTTGATSPTSAIPPVVDAVDGSGFRASAGDSVPAPEHGGVAGEDTPRVDSLSGNSLNSPALTTISPTAGAASDASGNIMPAHSSGLEPGLPGVVTACLNLKGALESKSQLEAYFHSKLLENFDSDKSGSLDSTELVAMMHVMGCEVSPQDVEDIVQQFDRDGNGSLDAAELLSWFNSPSFHSLPMTYHLLAFIADGKKGCDELICDVTRVVNVTDQTTKAGAGIIALQDADKELMVDRGLKIFDRKTGLILTENIPSHVKSALNLMYHSAVGSSMTKSDTVRKLLAKLSANEGAKMNLPSSRHKIKPFVDLHKINMSECEIEDVHAYPNFNAFFSRSLKPSARPIDSPQDENVVVSAADCRAVVYTSLSEATKIWVKGQSFTLENLLGPKCQDVLPLFMGGSLAVFRLSPQDYHRWHMPVTGRLGRRVPIDGALYTVNPIAIRRNAPSVYDQNKREILLVHTKPYGLVCLIAVGATVVGSISIVQPDGSFVEKGACHGFFQFGGSTVLALFQPGCVEFDADLLNYSRAPLETYLRVGERIGKAVPGSKPLMGIAEDDEDYVRYKAKTTAVASSAGGAVAVEATTTPAAAAPPAAPLAAVPTAVASEAPAAPSS